MFSAFIDLARAKNLLDEVVNRFGRDHRATNPNPDSTSTCTYVAVANGRPEAVCIVGQVVADLGLLGVLLHEDPTVTRDYQSGIAQDDACSLGANIWHALANVGVEVTDEAQEFFRYVQSAQDSGTAWGRAVEYGVEKVIFAAASAKREAFGLNPEWDKEPRMAEAE